MVTSINIILFIIIVTLQSSISGHTQNYSAVKMFPSSIIYMQICFLLSALSLVWCLVYNLSGDKDSCNGCCFTKRKTIVSKLLVYVHAHTHTHTHLHSKQSTHTHTRACAHTEQTQTVHTYIPKQSKKHRSITVFTYFFNFLTRPALTVSPLIAPEYFWPSIGST